MKMSLIDLNDFSSIELDIPEEVVFGTRMAVTDVPNAKRNGVVGYWSNTESEIRFSMTLIKRTASAVDIKAKMDWLVDRCYPKYQGDLIQQAQPKLLVVMGGMIPAGSEWELRDGVDGRARGYWNPVDGFLPPVMELSFRLVRVDSGAGRSGFGFPGGF